MKKWPLIENLALDIGFDGDAIRKWRERGRVPWRHRNALIELATTRGESLGWADCDAPAKRRAA